MINILKNKNKDEKIETIKKNNIYKCIQWCEKHKIPYNKFVDKINMFLPSITHDEGEREREREGDNIDDDIEYIGNDIGNEANYIVCDESLV